MKKIYRHADQAIKRLKSMMEAEFSRASTTLGFDEMNFIDVRATVNQMYSRIDQAVREELEEVAEKAYRDIVPVPPERKSVLPIGFLAAILGNPDRVTKYVYTNEWERKRDKLTESLMIAAGNQELRKALQIGLAAIAFQIAQYADNVTDRAREQAFEDEGITWVRWNTQRDERVCKECRPLDKMVFPLGKVPDKHYHCRCYLTPAEPPENGNGVT